MLLLHVTEYLFYFEKEYIFVWLYFFVTLLYYLNYLHVCGWFSTENVEEQ